MKRFIMAVVLSTTSWGAFACGGSGYSPDLAVGRLTSVQIAEQLEQLDKAYAIASMIDVVIGQTVSLVPHGGTAYNGGKAIGYAVMGDVGNASKAAISGVVSAWGQVPGLSTGKTVSFVIDVLEAVEVGKQAGGAFGR